MTLEEAKKLLGASTRSECRDHAFGDREVFWDRDGEEVAGGYFGSDSHVWIGDDSWSGADARELSRCGTVGAIDRNDSTGPDRYSDGVCMPGLTLAGVKKELCTPPDGGEYW